MNNRANSNSKGFIKAIIIIVIILIILAFYGFDIKDAVDSPNFKEKGAYIFNKVKEVSISAWNSLFGTKDDTNTATSTPPI